jgi:hypothetical protein
MARSGGVIERCSVDAFGCTARACRLRSRISAFWAVTLRRVRASGFASLAERRSSCQHVSRVTTTFVASDHQQERSGHKRVACNSRIPTRPPSLHAVCGNATALLVVRSFTSLINA